MGQAGPPRAGSIACPVFFRCGGRDTLRRVLPVKRSALQTCGLCRSSSGELVAEPPLAAPRPTRSLSLSKGAQEARRSASSLYRDVPARSWLPGATPHSPARRAGRNPHFASFESPRARRSRPGHLDTPSARGRHSMTGLVAGHHPIRPYQLSCVLGRARSEGGHPALFGLRRLAGWRHASRRFESGSPLGRQFASTHSKAKRSPLQPAASAGRRVAHWSLSLLSLR